MHYAEFAEDEVSGSAGFAERVTYEQQSVALREAIREYEANKWKAIGAKLGKPAKVGSFATSRSYTNLTLFRPVNSMPKSTSRTCDGIDI